MTFGRTLGTALALACLWSTDLAAELPATPEAAMERFVALNNSRALRNAEGDALLSGELDKIGSDGSGELPRADRVVATGDGKAAARIPAASGVPDLYFYLEKRTDGWTIVAYRSLALTGILQELIRLHELAPEPDPRIEEGVRNARLVLSSDRALIAWSRQHRDLLERARAAPESAEVERDLKAAGGNHVRAEQGLVFVSIGGILDNEVGFMWAPRDKLPRIDDSNYIWIEPAGGDWYLFKTS